METSSPLTLLEGALVGLTIDHAQGQVEVLGNDEPASETSYVMLRVVIGQPLVSQLASDETVDATRGKKIRLRIEVLRD